MSINRVHLEVFVVFVGALGVALGSAGTLAAQEQDASGYEWDNTTELSYVSTGGNASSSTLGLKSTLNVEGGPNAFTVEIGGIRGRTGLRTLTATGTATDFTVVETTNTELTAESYYAKGRYDRAFDSFYGFTGAGWDRNTFAGVKNRYSLVLGVGRSWAEGETVKFKTDLGATYTLQKDVDPAPGADESFAGIRLTVDAKRPLTETVVLTSNLVMDENLEETEDLRADWTNALAVSLSGTLAFKTSVQLLFDNQPSLLEVPLMGPGGTPTGTDVLTPSDKLDRMVTLALVITL